MKKLIYVFTLVLGFSLQAQNWTPLNEDQDKAGLELNPLKGIAANFGSNNGFPHSISNKNFTFGELVEDQLNAQGEPEFDFTAIEAFINEQSQMGRYAMIQINIDEAKYINPLDVITDTNGMPSYVGAEYDLPDFLANVNRLYYLGRPEIISANGVEPVVYADQNDDPSQNVYPWDQPNDGGGNPSLVVDYNNQDLVDTIVALVTELGNTYNGDERLFIVHYGMYGIFGEWGLGSGGGYIDDFVDQNGVNQGLVASDWEMSDFNQGRMIDAYQTAFTNTNLVARVPDLPRPESVGYSDGLYFGASISDLPQYNYFFLPKLKEANVDQNWKQHIIGGEMDPELQGKIWEQLNTTNPNTPFDYDVIGDAQFTLGVDITQNVEAVFEQTHPTFVFQNYMFQDNFIGLEGANHVASDPAGTPAADQDFPYSGQSNQTFWDNALLATKKMGYTFYVDQFKLTASNFKPSVEVNIKNTGIAPMYANWDVEFGYINTSGEVVSLGTTNTWNLNTIQPDVANNYRSFLSDVTLPDSNDGDNTDDVNTFTFVLRIVNPLSEIITTPENAKPVRFANETQDDNNLDGWLTLGTATLTGGNLGQTPVAVTGITAETYNQTMSFNSQQQLNPVVIPTTTTNASLTWVSENPNVLTVDANGLVTSSNISTYNLDTDTLETIKITAYTQDGGFVAEYEISVNPYWQIPARIEAEDYFNVFDAPETGMDGNDFFGFKTEVVTEGTETPGEIVISGLSDNDWIQYAVSVTEETYFRVTFRASSPTGQFGDAKLDIVDENGTLLTAISFAPETANINTYNEYISNAFILPIGDYILQLNIERSNFNLNWIEFKEIVYSPIPDRIEAEDYVIISSPDGNVPSVGAADGGSIIENIDDNDSMQYAISVNETANYVLDARAVGFSGPGDAQVNVLLNGNLLLENFAFGDGIANGTYGTSTSSMFSLPAGEHVIELIVTRSNFNLNWIEFRLDNTLSNPEFTTNQNQIKAYPNPTQNTVHITAKETIEDIIVYNVLGQEVLYKKGNSISFDLDLSNQPAGHYFAKIMTKKSVQTLKLVKI